MKDKKIHTCTTRSPREQWKTKRCMSDLREKIHVWWWQKGKDKDGILCTLAWATKAKHSNYDSIVDGCTKLWLWDIRVELSIDTCIQKIAILSIIWSAWSWRTHFGLILRELIKKNIHDLFSTTKLIYAQKHLHV